MRTTALAPGVTAVGSGDLSLAVAANRNVDAREVERALHHAVELGLTLVDVHPGEADAELLAADMLRTKRARDRVLVTTTIPLVPPRPGVPRRDLLPELLPVRYLQERVESSLRTTRLDAIPLVQLPLTSAWRSSTAWAELVGTCARLTREGKVLAWAARLDVLDEAALAFATDTAFSALSVVFSLCNRSAASLIAASKLPVLARQPLAGGALAGTIGPGMKLSPRDDRNELSPADLERAAVASARLAPELREEPPAARSCDAARAVLDRGKRPDHLEAISQAELALRFVIDQGAIALPRLHRHAHVMGAVIACAAPPLTPALLKRILDEKS
ncbi:MAG: aldo/keto reductase [Deltaproteobacteria bacterium]|nr:aldo/keto reductase [Deltaproteobacteria bacterium]